MRNAPIGFMDSGVGGLTILKEVQRLLPTEKTVYLGDQQRLPYGPRSPREVLTFTRQIATFLQRHDQIKLLVLACNTATAAALPALQQSLTIPVVGVIAPGARAAVQTTKTHQIGVIATAGTVKSQAYQRTITAQDPRNTVVSLACPELVQLAEANDLTSPHAQRVVADKLAPLQGTQIDTLVLGCTHFPLLRQVIQRVLGPGVQLVDPGTATANMVTALLDYWNLANSTGQPQPQATYYTTGDVTTFDRAANLWLDTAPVHAQAISLATLTQLDMEGE
ncbi:glutamate racemase [Levilactobacillus zymae]|uniref:glutamate racemase n=1 Tax=Levilactobacillus zymae TaxID=267363 RepID=UPI0028B3ECAC|nr:glutamate racemase [Levilactobacillus zymae]MDT6980944.1 glutamate racemase [Levilactobacillus zymae]